MRLSAVVLASLAVGFGPAANAKKYTKAKDAVLLSNVRTLTVRADKETANRRVPAIPQLKCVGGSARGYYEVDVLRCQNSGAEYDPEDIQWTCRGSLPPEFKLGSTEVVCEGYDSPDDAYILKGSCGVEYRLILTDLGEEKYGRARGYTSMFAGVRRLNSWQRLLNSLWKMLFWAIFTFVGLTLLSRILRPNNRGPRRPGFFGGGWGGGGGGGGGDDQPPPPYSPYKPASSGNSQSWQPGFWSGLATGAGAGYFMGNRNGSSSNQRYRDHDRARPYGSGPSLFGGGRSTASSSSSPVPSSSRVESTGFGGTRRR